MKDNSKVHQGLLGPNWALAGFLLFTKALIMKRPTENMEGTPMRFGKKTIAIGVAMGTLVIALLSLTTVGSASKCGTECTKSTISEQWLNAKTGMKDPVKSVYAASVLTEVKSNSSKPKTSTHVALQKNNGKVHKVVRTARDKEAENVKKALIALLIVAATESIQQSVSH